MIELSETERDALKLLRRQHMTTQELANKLERSRALAHKVLRQLQLRGLVERARRVRVAQVGPYSNVYKAVRRKGGA